MDDASPITHTIQKLSQNIRDIKAAIKDVIHRLNRESVSAVNQDMLPCDLDFFSDQSTMLTTGTLAISVLNRLCMIQNLWIQEK